MERGWRDGGGKGVWRGVFCWGEGGCGGVLNVFNIPPPL